MYLGFHYYGIMLPFTQFMDGPISKPKFQTTASIYLMCETLSVPQLESSMSWNHHNLLALQWRHNGRDSVSNNQPHDCLLNCLFRPRSKKTSKLHDTGLCVGNSLGTGKFSAQMASYVENVSIWWRHHGYAYCFWRCWAWPSLTCIFCKIAFMWMPQGHILISVGSGNGLVMSGGKPLL